MRPLRGDIVAARQGLFRADHMASVAVVVVALLMVLPTLGARFLYDDTSIVRDNATLRGWGALVRVWALPYWPSAGPDTAGLYRPLHVSMLAALWNAGGGSPLPFHLFALALYSAIAWLVWRLVRRGVGSSAAAVAGALWFAAHPLHVEVVGSVANASEMLVVLFAVLLTSLLRGSPPGSVGRASWPRAIGAGGLCAAAMLSKESGLLVLPVAALTAWGWHGARGGPDTSSFLRSNARVWIAGVVALCLTIMARIVVLGAPAGRASMVAPGLDAMAGGERVLGMLALWPRIVGMLLWPSALSPYYGPTVFPERRAALAAAALLALLAAIALAMLLARRGDRRPLVALGWMLLTYLPASNLLVATGVIVADRVLFGATVGAALGLAWLVDRTTPRFRVAVLGACALLASRNLSQGLDYAVDWTSHRRLWTRLVETSPAEYRGYQLLGIDARERGDTARARPLLARAFAMEPRDRRVRFEYGQVLYMTGDYAAASSTLQPLLLDRAVRGEPTFVALYLDAVGRARGPAGVVEAGTPLLGTEASRVAALYVGSAHEGLGQFGAAESTYVQGLLARPGDSALVQRRSALQRRARGR